MAFIVHVITGSIGHLSDFLELLPLNPGGPELHWIASKLESLCIQIKLESSKQS